MAMKLMVRTSLALCLFAAAAVVPAARHAGAQSAAAPVVLHAADAGPVMPATVFFKGQSAPIQARNSGGLKTAEGAYVLAALVDTSGYSSQVQEKYQAYLITERALTIDGHRLEPGAYGVGFIAEDTFLVMDLGGHDLFKAHSLKDASLRRPTPLQVMPAGGGEYRLYAGRTYVGFSLAASVR
jgi:hypothetical protein